MFRVEQCRTCFQPIIWAETDRGKPMPVDAEPPLSGGTIALVDRGRDCKPLARVLTTRELTGTAFGRTDLRTSHFTRCPQSDRWRARARGRARIQEP